MIQLLSKFDFKLKKEIAEDGMYMWLKKWSSII